MNAIYLETEYWAQNLNARDPFELLDAIGAIVRISNDFDPDGLKGFATIMNGIMYCTINGNLSKHDRRIVAGHEAAHLILHKAEILQSPACALKDFNLYDNSGRLEFEANTFLADFLVSDEDVLEAASNPDSDYFTTAKELYMPPPLLAFKLHSMMQRGLGVRNPDGLNSKFLGK